MTTPAHPSGTEPREVAPTGTAPLGAERISRAAIAQTEALIRPHIRRTPVIEVDGGDFGLPGLRIAFKLEQLQHGGAFKARGAFANLLLRRVPDAGVAAASGGNHGAAVAYAARALGVKARIFVPEISTPAKISRIRRYGAELVVGGARYADAVDACTAYVAQTGALNAPAYDGVETILGAATLGLEFEGQRPGLDLVLASVGGGGLLAGLAAWYDGKTALFGVEPRSAPCFARALEHGAPVDAPADGVAADSLGAKRIGALPFAVARTRAASALVADADIAAAQTALWENLQIVAEPGGAAAFAALLCGRVTPRAGACVGVVVSGANTGAVAFNL